jgi:hypothetical protein
MRWLRRKPKNVRLVQRDGTVIPLDCRYIGRKDGITYWSMVTPDGAVWGPGTEMRMDTLPAKTAVVSAGWQL